MRLQPPKLQDNDEKAKVLKAEGLPEDLKDVEGMLLYQGFLYFSKIIRSKVISCHHNDPLVRDFGIDKTQELVAKKHYWPIFRRNIETDVRGCNICLASKTICHKSYRDLQLLPVSIQRQKDILMDFVTGLLLFAD